MSKGKMAMLSLALTLPLPVYIDLGHLHHVTNLTTQDQVLEVEELLCKCNEQNRLQQRITVPLGGTKTKHFSKCNMNEDVFNVQNK